MKFVICLTILACLGASTLACNPHENNKPTCSASNVNEPIRNFWDPTGYWICESADGNAEMVHCPEAQLFDSEQGDCVWWDEWEWVDPCPED
ncbi:uncharacterized protein LOC101893283 [Musca domestica]|uniref:Uncharacterized protein LOC101893283 n=1 Tax=Musca domestica TaxID=7370 RepID=A0A1I8MXF7_MUSDO|nr:uncharacterized protein LOC101893283 [Musca domestica]